MDSQILTAVQLCEEFLNLKHNHNLVPLSGPGKAIEKGLMLHEMLQPYYLAKKVGKKRDDAAQAALLAGQVFMTGCEFCIAGKCDFHKERPVLGLRNCEPDEGHEVINTFLQYHEFWKNDSWTTIDVEKVKGKVIYEDEEISLLWKAKIDWLVDNEEGIFSTDHKTMGRREEKLSLNNQFIGQCVVTDQTKMFENIIGFQKSLKPEEKFLRVPYNFSKERIAEWIIETAGYAYDLVNVQERGVFRHKFISCRRRYGDCIFRKVCEGEPSDRERLLQSQFMVGKPWDIGQEDNED